MLSGESLDPRPDTIVARATPGAPSALAVVRLSGPRVREVLRRVAPDLPDPLPERRVVLTALVDPRHGELLDRGLVTFFPAPRSYTGEDVGEISCHGGALAPSLVLDACLRAGCREAEAGEFTRRAYLHGKLDLVQAEAVLDLVEGRSRALRRAALRQMDRGLSDRVSELREGLVETEALLAHHLDFPEEDDPPVGLERVVERGERVRSELDALLATAPEGELLREGALTVLAGRPNSGKSSLFNALLGRDRALVTAVPGTTRDAVEATVSLGGFPFRLVDTAGLRQVDEEVERLGIEVARRYLEAADLVLLCVEAGRRPTDEELDFLAGTDGRPTVLVRTKADLLGEGDPLGVADLPGETDLVGETRPDAGDGTAGSAAGRGAAASVPGGGAAGSTPEPGGEGPPGAVRRGSAGTVAVSSISGAGLDRLAGLLPDLVYGGLVHSGAEDPILTNRRQREAVESARDEVDGFVRALGEGVPAEVAATHLRAAESALEGLVGVVATDDVLDRLFRRFCIGK